jgi:hypothetical protein
MQVINDLNRKKKTGPTGHENLRQVTFARPQDNADQFYFLAATVVLIFTALLIIAACFFAVYFFYKLTFGNRERYFQFEDKVSADIELANRRVNLSKIEEEPEEDYESAAIGKKNEGPSMRSSIATRPQTQSGKFRISP